MPRSAEDLFEETVKSIDDVIYQSNAYAIAVHKSKNGTNAIGADYADTTKNRLSSIDLFRIFFESPHGLFHILTDLVEQLPAEKISEAKLVCRAKKASAQLVLREAQDEELEKISAKIYEPSKLELDR